MATMNSVTVTASKETAIPETLSDKQGITMGICMVISGLLSMFGSTTIVYRIVSKGKDAKTFDRLMLGLSIFDIFGSIAYILTPISIPAETSSRNWAIGNDVMCSGITGWLTQLSIGVTIYSSAISYYYMATLRQRISSADFAIRFEPLIHGLTFFFFLFTGTSGVLFHMYGEGQLGLTCWIVEIPRGCTEDGGGCAHEIIAWTWGGIPLMFTLFCLPVNYALTYISVRKMFKIMAQYNPAQAAHIRTMAIQGTLYVVAFYISWVPQLVLRSSGYMRSDEPRIYWLLLLNSITYPIQGFLNMIIYNRPNFMRLRAAGSPLWKALYAACFEMDIPKLVRQTSIRIQNSVHYNSSEELEDDHSNVGQAKYVKDETEDDNFASRTMRIIDEDVMSEE